MLFLLPWQYSIVIPGRWPLDPIQNPQILKPLLLSSTSSIKFSGIVLPGNRYLSSSSGLKRKESKVHDKNDTPIRKKIKILVFILKPLLK